jgi:hypothetical protein
VTSCSSSGLRALGWLHDTALVGMVIKVGQVFAFAIGLMPLEIFKQIQGDHASLIRIELNKVLNAIVHDLVHLEEKVCLISKELPCDILILVGVQDVAIGHRSQDGLDQVLEPLVYQVLLLLLELGAPLLLAEVLLEVLLHFPADQGLCFQNSFVH